MIYNKIRNIFLFVIICVNFNIICMHDNPVCNKIGPADEKIILANVKQFFLETCGECFFRSEQTKGYSQDDEFLDLEDTRKFRYLGIYWDYLDYLEYENKKIEHKNKKIFKREKLKEFECQTCDLRPDRLEKGLEKQDDNEIEGIVLEKVCSKCAAVRVVKILLSGKIENSWLYKKLLAQKEESELFDVCPKDLTLETAKNNKDVIISQLVLSYQIIKRLSDAQRRDARTIYFKINGQKLIED